MVKKHQSSDVFFLLALIFSGAAALGYELLWTRLLALSLGGEVLGVLGVLAGFFGGMVLGAFVLSKHASTVKKPLRTFFILEFSAAVYGLLSPWLIYSLSHFLPAWLGPVAGDNNSFPALLITVGVAGLALLPATFCIGANFAYLVEARRRVFPEEQKDKNLGRVYGANTFGATLGVFSAVYWIMPILGLAWSGVFYAVLGLIAIGLAYFWQQLMKKKRGRTSKKKKTPKKSKVSPNFVYWLLFGTGLASIGLEIVVVHLLKQILQNTVFTFANLLAIYLLGTAIGAWVYQLFVKKGKQNISVLLFNGMLFSLTVLVFLVGKGGIILEFLSPENSNYQGHLLAEVGLAFILFLLPTFCMGALFSHLMSWLRPSLIGRAYAINTLGSTFSPFIFGLLIIPLWGSVYGFLLVAGIYFILLFTCVIKLDWPKFWLVPGALLLLIIGFSGNTALDLISIEKGMKELERKEGLMGTVLVVEEPKRDGPFGLPLRTLQINNHFRMGGGVSFLERRMGNLPLLIANQPQKVLFLGVGTGTTLGVVRDYPVQEVQAVEIVPEVKDLLPLFAEHNLNVLADSRLEFNTADARRFVAASREKYDLIISDLFHPARDGAGLLYTKEHFTYLSRHLTANGIAAQWIPLHQFDLENLKVVIRTFQDVFPNTHAFLGGYNARFPIIVLLSSNQPFKIDPSAISLQIAARQNIQMAFENVQDLLGSYLIGPESLAEFAGEGPLNTDLNPRVLFEAPKSIYTSELDRAQTNIDALLAVREPLPVALVENPARHESILDEVMENWRAIGHFIEGNRFAVKGDGQNAWKKYIDAYVANPDFSPARGKLFQAVMEGRIDRTSLNGILIPRDRERLDLILRR